MTVSIKLDKNIEDSLHNFSKEIGKTISSELFHFLSKHPDRKYFAISRNIYYKILSTLMLSSNNGYRKCILQYFLITRKTRCFLHVSNESC